MGMDLIVSVAVQEHPERSIADLRSKLNELSLEEANDIFEATTGLSWEEYRDLDDETTDGALFHVKEWIEEFISTWASETYHRSIVILHHPQLDKIIAIGGGDSWGDTPNGLDAVTAVAEWGEW